VGLTFGMWMLFASALGLRPVAIAMTAGLVLAAVTTVATQTLRRRHPTEASVTGRSAEVVSVPMAPSDAPTGAGSSPYGNLRGR
jgi:hypothetical protein